MSVTGSIMAGVGLAGSIGGAAISSNAAGNAADTQSAAANHAADLQYQASQQALDFQKQQYNQGQANLQPWLNSGAGALSNLDYLLGIGSQNQGAPSSGAQGGTSINPSVNPSSGGFGVSARPMLSSGQPTSGAQGAVGINPAAFGGADQSGAHSGGVAAMSGLRPVSSVPGAGGMPSGVTSPNGGPVNTSNGAFGSLMQPYQGQFTAPTNLTEQNDPGYQARLQLGTDTIQKSAAARGSVLTGGTAKALTGYAQDYASNEYGNVYNRAYNDYATKYNQYNQNQTNQYNRLASLAGVGQQTASTLGTLGQNAASGISNNLLSTASNMGNAYQNAGAANASGYYNSAQAWNQGISGSLSSLSQLQQLKQLYGGSPNGALTIGGNGSITNAGY